MNSTLGPNAKLSVRFISRWQVYYPGDVASFPARMAATLVARGKAEKVNIAPPDAPVPEGAEWTMRRPGNNVVKDYRGEEDLEPF